MADLSKMQIELEARQAMAGLDKIDNKLDDVDRSAKQASGSLEKMGRSAKGGFSGVGMAGAGAAAAGAAIAAAFVATGVAIIKVNAEYQKLQANLVTVAGSTEKAAAQFAALQEFAKKTPFSLAEVTQAFTKLQAYGLATSAETLTNLGNISAGLGKNVTDLVEAVADATMGEFERLKSFNIKARKDGEEVAFTYKNVTTKVANNARDIQAYIEKIGATDFAGGMARQTATLEGAWANLKDTVANTFAELGNAGLNDFLMNMTNGFTDAVPKIKEFFTIFADVSGLNAFIEAVGRVVSSIQSWMGQTSEFAGVVATNGEHITNAMLTAAKVVGDTVKFIWDGLSSILTAFMDTGSAIVKMWSAFFETGVGKITKTVLVGMVNAVTVAVKFIANAVFAIPKAFIEAYGAAAKVAASFWTRMNALMKGNLGAFNGFWTEAAGYAKQPFDTVGKLVGATIGDIQTAIKDTSDGSITALKGLGNAYAEVDAKRRAAAAAAAKTPAVDMSALNTAGSAPDTGESEAARKAREKAEKEAREEAARKLKEFEDRVKSLTETYAPAVARQREWAETAAFFNQMIGLGDEGLKKYGLTVAQVKEMMAAANEEMNQSFFSKALDDLKFEEATIKASEFSDAASQAAAKVLEIGRAAKQAHEPLSEAQKAELQAQIATNLELQKSIDLRNQQREANKELAKSVEQRVQDLQDEAYLMGLVGKEREREEKLLSYRREVERSGASIEAQADAIRKYTAALDDLDKRKETLNTFAFGAKQAMVEYTEAASNIAQTTHDGLSKVFSSLEDNLADFIKTGKFNMKSFLGTLADQLAQFAAKGIVAMFLKLFIGGGTGGIGGLLGGLFAEGGSPPVGRVSVVGEREAELFVPKQPGNILNSAQLRAITGGAANNNAPSYAPSINLGGITINGGSNLTPADLNRFGDQIVSDVMRQIVGEQVHNGVLGGRR